MINFNIGSWDRAQAFVAEMHTHLNGLIRYYKIFCHTYVRFIFDLDLRKIQREVIITV